MNNFTVFSISNTEIKGCKTGVEYFKTLTNRRFGTYSSSNLKMAYNKMTGLISKKKINFYISNGIIVLAPETGKGFNVDIAIILDAFKNKVNVVY